MNTDTSRRKINFELGIASLFATITGILYASGYLVHAILLRNLGVQSFEAVKLQYIEMGLTYVIFLTSLSVVPVLCIFSHFRIRWLSGLPNKHIGATVYSINTVGLFQLLIFLPVFVHQEDFSSRAQIFGINYYFQSIVYTYFGVGVAFLILYPLWERVWLNRVDPTGWFIIVELPRFLVFFAVAFLFFNIFLNLDWFGEFASRALIFLGLTVFSCLAVYGMYYWISREGKGYRLYALLALCVVGCVTLFYISVHAYVWGIVRYIPVSRGGKLPISEAYFAFGADYQSLIEDKIGIAVDKRGYIGPLYVVDESTDTFYVITKSQTDWTSKWVQIFSLPTASVRAARFRPIDVNPFR